MLSSASSRGTFHTLASFSQANPSLPPHHSPSLPISHSPSHYHSSPPSHSHTCHSPHLHLFVNGGWKPLFLFKWRQISHILHHISRTVNIRARSSLTKHLQLWEMLPEDEISEKSTVLMWRPVSLQSLLKPMSFYLCLKSFKCQSKHFFKVWNSLQNLFSSFINQIFLYFRVCLFGHEWIELIHDILKSTCNIKHDNTCFQSQ